jgi:hypothetical protein
MPLNPSTLVVVHCYAGDRARVEAFMPFWLHHECPVLVLSPEDAPVELDHHPLITYRSAGRAGWKGPHTVHRQIAHWKIAAEFPQKHFLMHDSDSVCLSPELPRYLYAEPDVFWCNVIGTHYLNYEPPYFLSRENLLRMIDIADHPNGTEMQKAIGTIIRNDRGTLLRLKEAAEHYKSLTPKQRRAYVPERGGFEIGEIKAIVENPTTLEEELARNLETDDRSFPDWGACNAIDGFYVAMTSYLGLPFKSYPDGSHGGSMGTLVSEFGFRMLHPVKRKRDMDMLVTAYNHAVPPPLTLTDVALEARTEDQSHWTFREPQGGLAEGESIGV